LVLVVLVVLVVLYCRRWKCYFNNAPPSFNHGLFVFNRTFEDGKPSKFPIGNTRFLW